MSAVAALFVKNPAVLTSFVPALPLAQTPSVDATLSVVATPNLPRLSVDRKGSGKATVGIGNEYEVALIENSSEVRLKKFKTGNTAKIWGDPHVCSDGSGRNNVVTGDGQMTLVPADGRTTVLCDSVRWCGDLYITDKATAFCTEVRIPYKF
jgi:Domain of Unknown Function (DUF1521)